MASLELELLSSLPDAGPNTRTGECLLLSGNAWRSLTSPNLCGPEEKEGAEDLELLGLVHSESKHLPGPG